MNNIYKVIWSKAKNCYVVASEIARSHTKSASGSEKIGGVARHALLALGAACAIACGGFVNVGAAVQRETISSAGTTSNPVLTASNLDDDAHLNTVISVVREDKLVTKDNIAGQLTDYAKASDLSAKADANDVYTKTDAGNTFATKTELRSYATKTELNAKADATALDDKADKTAVTELEGRVSGVEGKVTTLENTVGNDSRGLVKDVNDLRTQGTTLNNALGSKADKSDLDAAKAKITNITHDATGTSVDGVTFNAGAVTGVTSINGTKIGTPQDGKYISQDGSIWGNMKKVDTQVETNEKNIETNKAAITNLDAGLQKEVADRKTSVDAEKTEREKADEALSTDIKKETSDREAADAEINKKIGSIDNNQTKYVKDQQTISQNLTKLDNELKDTNDRTGGITRNDAERKTIIEKNVTVDSKGNVTAEGKLKAGSVDAGDGAITTTDAVNAGSLNVTNGATSLKETTVNGKLTAKENATFKKNVTVQNDLTVNGKLNVDKISMKNNELKNGKKHDSATTITADEISNAAKVTDRNGVTTESTFTHDKEGSTTYAYQGDAANWKKSTSNVTADGVSNKMTDSAGNTHTYYQTAAETKEQLVNGDKSNFEKKTAEGNTISIKDKDADGNKKSLTNTQTVDEEKTSVTNKDSSSTIKQGADQIRHNVTSADGKKSSIEVKAEGITNTSKDGTITNDAKDIVNNATGDMTNTVGGKLTTTVGGQATENFNSGLNTTVNGAENHTVNGQQTNTVRDGQINNITGGQTNNILTGDQKTTVSDGSIINKAEHGDISNTAKNVTNEGTESVTNKVGTNEVKVSKDGVNIKAEDGKKITESVGTASRVVENDKITDEAGNSTVTTENGKGTTFGKEEIADTTNIYGDSIKTGTINARDTTTGKLTAGAAADVDGGRLTVDANDGVKGSYKYGDYTSRSYILANTLQSGVDNGKDITDNGFVGSRTDHYMDVDKAKLNETVKDADGSNVTKKTSTKTYTEIKDTNGNTLSVNQKADGNNYKLEDQDGNTNHVTNSATQSKQTLKDKDGNTLTTNQTATKNNFDLKSADGSKENHTTNTVDESRVAIKGENGKAELSTTDEGTTFKHSAAKEAFTEGGATNTTIKGNTITTGKVTMDYADVMKDLGVYGNTTLGEAGKDTTLTVNSKATFNEIATFENGAEVKNGLTVSSGGLNVTGESTFNDKVNMKNGLDVTGGVASDSFTVKGTDIKIDSSGINAGGTVISNVADGSISEGSKDAVNGGQLYNVKNDLEGKVNKVGANAAAMANLHPMEFDPDSKWNIAAAIGNYGSETAAALGAFYRPNDDVMVNLSTAFGTGENMVGGGVSVRLGKGGNKLSREESNALKDQVNDLTARMDALLSVLNPNMSKDFPDVPENHWAYEAVSRLAGNDIVQGYPDGEFHGERTMTRYEMAEIIYNALSRGAEAEKELVEEFKPELQAMAASEKATAERAEG